MPKNNPDQNPNDETTSDETTTDQSPPRSKLQVMLKEWPGELPPVKEQKRLKGAYVKARSELEAAKEAAKLAIQEAETAMDLAAVECVEAFGPTPLQIDGVLFTPMCRGERVYYRKQSDQRAPI